jgi:pSer/pThr/pTyr-binding forkhead associated (FHA) protein
MTDRGWALRFISGKYQGGEYPIGGTGDLVIGRASDLDMVLIEDMVSRKHAKLHIGPSELTISDLGSTNGTFVNGEKVKTAKLKEGDRILIGTSILKLIAIDRLPGEVMDRRAAQAGLEKAAAQKQKTGGERSAVQGRLEEVPLVDLLQLLSTSKKTGAIVIRGIRGGRVHLRKGRVISASVDADPSVPPKKALFRMTTWGQGSFEFVPLEGEQAPMPNEITESTEILVMEALRQGDDLAIAGLPPPTAAIGIAMPLTAKLRDLPPDEIDLVQLVHNYGVVQAVLDRASGSDADTAQKLASLIQRGYLRQF